MNRREARRMADDREWTKGELRKRIRAAEGSRTMSAVNPAVPHARALSIYSAALVGDDGDLLPGNRIGTTLLVSNILRDTS